MKIIRNLTINKRLFISLIAILIPVLILLIMLSNVYNRSILFSKKEAEGLKLNQKIWQISIEVQDQIVQGEMLSIHSKISQDMNALIESLDASPFTHQSEEWNNLVQNWKQITIASENSKNQLKSSDWFHLQKKLELVFSRITDQSNLILDPDLDTFYLMELSMVKSMLVSSSCSNAIQHIESTMDPKSNFSDSQLDFALKSSLVDCKKNMDGIDYSFEKEYNYNPNWKAKSEFQKNQMIKAFDKFHKKAENFNSSFLFRPFNSKEVTQIISEYKAYLTTQRIVYELIIAELDRLLQLRINGLQMEMVISLASAILICAIVFLFQFFINRTISIPILDAVEKFDSLSQGNINQSFQYPYNDEIGKLFKSSQFFINELNQVLNTIQQLVGRVKRYAEQTALMAEMLSDSSQSQASQTEESSAAIEEISASFDKVAKLIEWETNDIQEIGFITTNISNSILDVNNQMSKLKKVADTLMLQARSGESMIQNTTESMSYMKEVSGKIGGIVSIITDISSQTNLLSLNAAIEAARAGDMGKGFAVVASEVSILSEKTQRSVKEIKKLIQLSDQTVDEGVHSVESSVEAITNILANISEIHSNSQIVVDAVVNQSNNVNFIHKSYTELKKLSDEIDMGAKEEKISIDQVTESLQLIAQSTQLIANNAGALSEISGKLDHVSEQLMDSIRWFKL
jgi:methyl-accepting chemotaxis protein